MALDTAQELGLDAIRFQDTRGAGGIHKNQVFESFLTIEFEGKGIGEKALIQGTMQVIGIPELGTYMDAQRIRTDDPHPKRMIGLLGRDFLRHGLLTYNGVKGTIDLVLDLDSLAKVL